MAFLATHSLAMFRRRHWLHGRVGGQGKRHRERLPNRLDPGISAQICALTLRFFYRKIKETEGRRKTAGE
jgi:hypothetical protein